MWIAGTAPVGSPSSLRTKIVLLHWNGRSWQRLAQPGSGLGYYNSVQGVRVVSATSAWVVGWDKLGPNEDERRLPLALHWNGRRWTTTRMPAGRGELDNVTVADGQVLASGDTFSPDQTSYGLDLLRWTGRAWVHEAVPASGPGTMGGIAGIPGGGVWVTGSTGDTTGETGRHPHQAADRAPGLMDHARARAGHLPRRTDELVTSLSEPTLRVHVLRYRRSATVR